VPEVPMPKRTATSGFARRLREIRLENGLTQEALARLAGLHKLAIAKLEQGVVAPTWTTVVALVDALKLAGGDFWVPPKKRIGAPQARVGRPPAREPNRQRPKS
jgi:transcriptional regulator with XRE-family HTH domain